ncbi:PAAR domain-containing protein [Halomonas sp. TD01]|uniref:PAAR domain-containing protein n=1 Tax=Halomonas sp. TD01 TaxID=999141 RepID=UPI000214F193|nr:PAAR domain-containing protein [Halomonas sp. TD01]EGP20565.1 PAAR motif-containing protein [Halomonas sp. TD01]CAH1041753.1 PAAR [Halomonas sp. TD01]
MEQAKLGDQVACPCKGGPHRIVSAASTTFIDGVPAARVGDRSSCGDSIVTGLDWYTIEGAAAAIHGSQTSCGGTVIAASSAVTGQPSGGANTSSLSSIQPPNDINNEYGSPRANNLGEKSAQGGASEQVLRDEQEPPIVNMAEDRWESIVNDTPAIFEIEDNPNTSGKEPWYALNAFEEVNENKQAFEEVGREVGVDTKLLRAIAYIETTHGYYDRIHPRNTSFRPMNINYEYWKPIADEAGFTRYEVVNYPYPNIYVSAVLLKRIQARVVPSSIEKVASIYNALGAEHVNDYGARVKFIYDQELWESRSE